MLKLTKDSARLNKRSVVSTVRSDSPAWGGQITRPRQPPVVPAVFTLIKAWVTNLFSLLRLRGHRDSRKPGALWWIRLILSLEINKTNTQSYHPEAVIVDVLWAVLWRQRRHPDVWGDEEQTVSLEQWLAEPFKDLMKANDPPPEILI